MEPGFPWGYRVKEARKLKDGEFKIRIMGRKEVSSGCSDAGVGFPERLRVRQSSLETLKT